MCGLGSRWFFTLLFLDGEKKYSRNLTLRSKFFDVPRTNLAGSGSSCHRLQSCFLLETSAVSPWSWKTSHSECLQIFATSCQEPLPPAAHPKSLVMCISHLSSEATQWSLDFLEQIQQPMKIGVHFVSVPVSDVGQDWKKNLYSFTRLACKLYGIFRDIYCTADWRPLIETKKLNLSNS